METEKQPCCGGEEKQIKTHLLNAEPSPCVCSRLAFKGALEGWQPKEGQKTSKKRVDTSRGGNQVLSRRERTIIAASRGDFLFRHYESLGRYIEQYRENHASTCMERDMRDARAVLGIDVPDPYLPKIASSSVLIERIKIIEALSSYYNTERDVKNICLTGRKPDSTTESNSLLISSMKTNSFYSLPEIESNNNNDNNIDNEFNNSNNFNTKNCLLPTVNENDECTIYEEKTPKENDFTTFAEKLRRNQDMKDIIRVTSSGNTDKRPKTKENYSKTLKKETLILPSAKLVCKETEKSRNEMHFKTTFPQIWNGFEQQKVNKKPDRVLETLRIGKKVKISKENSSEELYDDNLNLRSLETREGISSRGNLCLGTTVRPVTSQKEKRNNKKLSKTSSFPCDHTLQQLSRTAKNSPRETTFIRILGQPKGPFPSDKGSNMAANKLERTEAIEKAAKSRQSIDYGIPLSYLRRYGRRNFHHVLEARSYKPETREMGTTIIPN